MQKTMEKASNSKRGKPNDNQRPEKKCRVCGDQALGFNFGGQVSCESCKTFFRRSLCFNIKKPSCKKSGQCVINVHTRRYCSSCRLQKCLAIGMKAEALLGRHQQRTLSTIESQNATRELTSFEQQCLGRVREDSDRCFASETQVPLVGELPTFLDFLHILAVYVKKYVAYAECFEAFRSIPTAEQVSLLKRIFVPNLALRKAFDYDRVRQGAIYFKNEECSCCWFFPYPEHLAPIVPKAKIDNLTSCMDKLNKELEADQTMLNLLHVTLFFDVVGGSGSGGGGGGHPTATIGACRDYLLYQHHFYRHLLRRYLTNKYQSAAEANTKMVRLTKLVTLLAHCVHLITPEVIGAINCAHVTRLTVEILDII